MASTRNDAAASAHAERMGHVGSTLHEEMDAPGRSKAPKLGTGERFHNLEGELASKGAKNPGALAAYIGRRKFGAKRFAALGAAGRK